MVPNLAHLHFCVNTSLLTRQMLFVYGFLHTALPRNGRTLSGTIFPLPVVMTKNIPIFDIPFRHHHISAH